MFRFVFVSVVLLIALGATGQNISVALRSTASAPSVTIINPPGGFTDSGLSGFSSWYYRVELYP
jgi:hypothetical protein